jgi:transposase
MRVHRNCCGLDVHKKIIAACLIREDGEGNITEKRLFGSMTRELHELAHWLCASQVTAVAMEATSVYWMPVWNVLEQYGLQLLLINPEHYKAVRGKKTDLKDGTRIAELLQDGRLEGSYVPPVAIRVLRDLTRYRTKLVQYQSAIANRIQRLLEQGNIKLASVASDALGVSAMAMLRALAQGETDAARMAEMAKKQLRKKIPQLQLALEGCLLPHHRWLLSEMIEDLDHVGAKISRIEETIEQQMRPFQNAVDRWLTVPGVKHRLAWTLVAEVGPTVEAFPSAADLVSWAGVCPGNNQTAGKRKSGTTRAGNPFLRRALCEAAWAASKKKGTYLQAQFRRLAALRGPKRALVAVASSILTAGYYILQRATTYQELGPDYFDKRNTVRATHRLVKRLEALGHRVILEPHFSNNPIQASSS